MNNFTATSRTEDGVFDYIIVGAGVLGSSVAQSISSKEPSSRVLLLEQFEALHANGSSHGNSRIIRFTYDDTLYSKMGQTALDKWKKLQMEYPHCNSIYTNTGTLDFGSSQNSELQKVFEVVKKNRVEHEILDAKQLRQRFPALRDSAAITDDYVGVFQKDGGSLNATECVRMLQYFAVKNGVLFKDREPVLEVSTTSSDPNALIYIRTTHNIYVCKKVILSMGSWTPQFVNNLVRLHGETKQAPVIHHVQVHQMSYAFWDVKSKVKEFEAPTMPIWMHWGKTFQGYTLEQKQYLDTVTDATELAYYGFPTLPCENHGYIKAGIHFAISDDHLTDASVRSFSMPEMKKRLLKTFMRKMFNLDYEDVEEPKQIHTCLYTTTFDHDFIIDHHPKNSNIIIAAGGSGHLFKFGPVVGDLVAGMATDSISVDDEHRLRFKLKGDYGIPSRL